MSGLIVVSVLADGFKVHNKGLVNQDSVCAQFHEIESSVAVKNHSICLHSGCSWASDRPDHLEKHRASHAHQAAAEGRF
jgi:hypothetical protein